MRSGTVAWTYGGLDARADEIASVLASHGVRRGDLVAIAVPRSEYWPLAVWAITNSVRHGCPSTSPSPTRAVSRSSPTPVLASA